MDYSLLPTASPLVSQSTPQSIRTQFQVNCDESDENMIGD